MRQLFFILAFVSSLALSQTLEEGRNQFTKGDFAGARAIFETLLDRNDEDAAAHYWLAMVYYSRNNKDRNMDEAVDHFEEASDLDPNNAEYQFQYAMALGEKVQNAGVLKQVFLAPRVKTALIRAIELNPNNVQARIALSQYYLRAPGIMGGDKEKGERELDTILQLDEVQGRIVRAAMFEREKNYSQAEEEFKRLKTAFPKDWQVWKNLGYFKIRTDKFDEAIQCFKKFVELRPDTADSYAGLGVAYLRKKEADSAMVQIQRSLSIEKDFGPSLLLLAQAYEIKGMKKEALEAYRHILDVDLSQRRKDIASEKIKELQ